MHAPRIWPAGPLVILLVAAVVIATDTGAGAPNCDMFQEVGQPQEASSLERSAPSSTHAANVVNPGGQGTSTADLQDLHIEPGTSADLAPAAAETSDTAFRCGFEAPTPEQQAAIQSTLDRPVQALLRNPSVQQGTKNIPVRFHVIKGSSSESDVSESTLNNQIDVLNNRFQGTPFSFTLAEVTRTVNANWSPMPNMKDRHLQALASLRKGDMATLNVLVTQLEGALGLAFPGLQVLGSSVDKDGVLLDVDTLPGGSYTNNRALILVHEVGHWLGLLHTFQGGCSEQYGDFISDTNAESNPSSATKGCPAVGDSTTYDSCPSLSGLDPTSNYMAYVQDPCMTNFTPVQRATMTAMYDQYRAPVCANPPPVPNGAWTCTREMRIAGNSCRMQACFQGYFPGPKGLPEATCRSDLTWSAVTGSCGQGPCDGAANYDSCTGGVCLGGACVSPSFAYLASGQLAPGERSSLPQGLGQGAWDYTGARAYFWQSTNGNLCTYPMASTPTNPTPTSPLWCLQRTGATGQNYVVALTNDGRLVTFSSGYPIFASPVPQYIPRAGARFFAFAAPDGGVYVVYGLTWAERDSRIVLNCSGTGSCNGNPTACCQLVPLSMPLADYQALSDRVFTTIKQRGSAF